MNEHVTAWLDAYQDGELRPAEQRRVEAHLTECSTCREELAARQVLSDWIRGLPKDLPFTPTERFTAQVMLRLPPRHTAAPQTPAALLWGLPLGLLLICSMLQALWGLIAWLRFGVQSGLLAEGLPNPFIGTTQSLWVALLTVLGGVSPSPVLQTATQWLQQTDRWFGEWLGLLTWQAQVTLLYWVWLLLWGWHQYRIHPRHPDKTEAIKSA